MAPKRSVTLGESIGNNLRSLREKKYPTPGSQTKCAADFGVRSSEWSMWERNKRTPADETQSRLAEFFGVSIAELRGESQSRDDNKKSPPMAGMEGPVNIADLSLMALELQEELNNIHRRALEGVLKPEEFKAILLAVTASVEQAALGQKENAASQKTTA